MKIIGITGKSGSGKTTFAKNLSTSIHGTYVDVDKIGHEALFRQEILEDLCYKFGTKILDNNGNLDRKKIGNIVFSRER